MEFIGGKVETMQHCSKLDKDMSAGFFQKHKMREVIATFGIPFDSLQTTGLLPADLKSVLLEMKPLSRLAKVAKDTG